MKVRCCRVVRAGMTKEVRRKRGKDGYLISGTRDRVIDRLRYQYASTTNTKNSGTMMGPLVRAPGRKSRVGRRWILQIRACDHWSARPSPPYCRLYATQSGCRATCPLAAIPQE